MSINFDTLKKGDVFYECEYGITVEARVTSNISKNTITIHDKDRIQWVWEAVDVKTGEPISYMVTEGLEHYGPRLYKTPQYT